METSISEIKRVAEFLGKGYFCLNEKNKILEVDSIAKAYLGITEKMNETDIRNYKFELRFPQPNENETNIDFVKKNKGKTLRASIHVELEEEMRVLPACCWYLNADGNDTIQGLVYNIEVDTLFPILFDELPIGVYQLDDQNKIRNFNTRAMQIFGYENRKELIGKPIDDFYADRRDMETFAEKVRKNKFASDILKFKDKEQKIIELECSTKLFSQLKRARWGMIHDVTERERYYRALGRLPTSYYYIDYTQKPRNDKHPHSGIIRDCNDKFVELLGEKKKADVIGKDVRNYYSDTVKGEDYFKALDEMDKKGNSLLNYHFELVRADNRKTIPITVDSHLVKDNNGKIIGREGILRDFSEEVKLKQQFEEAETQLERLTADINKLIHTFLHPVIKFAGNAELLHQVGENLYQSILPDKFRSEKDDEKVDPKATGKDLMNWLTKLKNDIDTVIEDISSQPDFSTLSKDVLKESLIVGDLREEVEKIANSLHYAGTLEESDTMFERTIRDSALWILGELNKYKYSANALIHPIIKSDFIECLHNILFKYMEHGAKILASEAGIMKRTVEALRSYIGLKKEREYFYSKYDLGHILEENIELFKPVLLEEGIEIDYHKTGDLSVEISPNDIDRVICNLFHNVKKYAYGGKGRFSKVRAKQLTKENKVEFFIESFGYPIKKEEIESGEIWNFGYRGKMAFESDRDGTGVGLADTKAVIEKHGGEIHITSLPVFDDGEPPRYKSPYLTCVTIILPKSQRPKELYND